MDDLIDKNIQLAKDVDPEIEWKEVRREIEELIEICKLELDPKISGGQVLRPRDYERIVIWPTIIKALYCKESLSNSKNWGREVRELCKLWTYFTVVDKVADGEMDQSMLPEEVDFLDHLGEGKLKQFVQLQNSYKNEEGRTETLEEYIGYLSKRYEPYGEYVFGSLVTTCQKDESLSDGLVVFLRNLLVIQQILDDIGDWELDIREQQRNWIAETLKLYKSRDEQKKHFVLQVLPELVNGLRELVSQSEEQNVGNESVRIYLNKLLGIEEEIIEDLGRVIWM